MSEELPRRVRAGSTSDPEAVSLDAGRRALLSAVRDAFVDREPQRTAAGAADVWMAAQLQELADEADRDKGELTSNDEHELLSRTGLSLRVPPANRTANDQAVYGFYRYQQDFLEAVAGADADHEVSIPDDERARRALSYAGAELIAERRVAARSDTTDDGDDRGDRGPEATPTMADVYPEGQRGTYRRYGIDDDQPPAEVHDWIEDTLEGDFLGVLTAGSGDERAVREDLRDIRAAINQHDVTERGDLRLGEFSRPAADGDDSDASTGPDPEAGVLGFDWVGTDESRWSGRGLRSLLYALVTERDGLALPEDAVDRVELINYGEPTVRAYEVPSGRHDLTLNSGDSRPLHGDDMDQHAIEFRILADVTAGAVPERDVENHLEEHLNYLQMLARYDEDVEPEMATDAAAGDPRDGEDEVAADGDGGGARGVEATRRIEEGDALETPFDDLVPAALQDRMDFEWDDLKAGDLELDVYVTDGEIVGSSYSWEASE